jgi:hypothetical protein
MAADSHERGTIIQSQLHKQTAKRGCLSDNALSAVCAFPAFVGNLLAKHITA